MVTLSSFSNFSYRTLLKRSPSLLLIGVVGAVFLERTIDYVSLRIWHNLNKGKLWDDIKHKYEK